jgi:hypothetical protein
MLGLGYLERPALELALHVHVIFETDDPAERLRAYLVWCLDADRQYWASLSHIDHLERAYDPRPARDHILVLQSLDPRIAELFGDIEELSDQEAEFDRERTRRQAEAAIAQIDSLLGDARLAAWSDRIAALRDKKRFRYGVHLYTLFNESEASIYQRLVKTDSKHAYLGFSRGSAILHGSTLEHSLRLHDSGVAPLIGATERELAAGLEPVLNWIQWVALMLSRRRPSTGDAAEARE